MKKFFLGLVVIILAATAVCAGDYYVVGVDYFNKGDYQKASGNLETAVRINPKNVNARYYLAQAYLKQKRISEASEQYNRIIILAPSSDASKLSEKGLSLIRQAYLSRSGDMDATYSDLDRYKDNYITYVLTSGTDVKKWASFPIKVYIEPQKQKSICQKAFTKWQEQTNKLVSFTFVPTAKEAQITLTFQDKLENSDTDEAYISGITKPYANSKNITSADIKILTIDPNTKKDIDDSFVFFATLHEIGHALGMQGHSPDKNDIMVAQSSNAKTELSKRDINTISLFYRANKETLASKNKKGMDVRLQQAIDYANTYPEKAIGWANLGDIYSDKNMYKEALISYKKASTIEPQDARLYACVGSAYNFMGDNNNAFINFRKACDLDKTNEIYLFLLSTVCQSEEQIKILKLYIK